jgi:acetyl-CoA carboxylase biotin carboxylase subunit
MFVIEGIYTSIPLHQKILADTEFAVGKLDTKLLERMKSRA